MDINIYKNYLAILREEMIPAMGCTEPIAVALCVAKAAETSLEKSRSVSWQNVPEISLKMCVV